MNYSNLTPRRVLDSLDAVGLRGDGRILQLNSYENRVFQVFLEDGRAVVAKFYRPGRWSDAQIVEEHAFALELAAAEVSVVPPLVLQDVAATPGLVLHGDPPTLACHSVDGATHRFAVAERCAGREPELEDPATLERIGRFIGRLHAVGQSSIRVATMLAQLGGQVQVVLVDPLPGLLAIAAHLAQALLQVATHALSLIHI